jgi:hypothetical protein
MARSLSTIVNYNSLYCLVLYPREFGIDLNHWTYTTGTCEEVADIYTK